MTPSFPTRRSSDLGASVRTGERHLNRAVDIAATEPQVVATGEIVAPLVGDGEALQRCVPAQHQGIESACKGAFHSGAPGGPDAPRVRSNLGIGQAPAIAAVAHLPHGEGQARTATRPWGPVRGLLGTWEERR